MPQDKAQVLSVWQAPFSMGSPTLETWDHGITLAEIVARMPDVPQDFASVGIVTINEHEIPRALWHCVRPAAFTVEMHTTVTLQYPVRGGNRGGKQILALVAAVALSLATAGIANGFFATSSGLFASGTLSAKLLAGAASIVGALVVGALTAPPVSKQGDSGGGDAKNPAGIQGNLLEANAIIPRVLGKRRVFPPFLAEPYIELVGQDEYVTAVCGLAGPHKLSRMRMGDTNLDDATAETYGITIETRTGLAGDDGAISFLGRQSKTVSYGATLTVQQVDSEDESLLSEQGLALPAWYGTITRINPEEFWMHLQFQGLILPTEEKDLRVAMRLRMRPVGTETWINLPELHYVGYSQKILRTQIKFFWKTPDSGIVNIPERNNFTTAYIVAPGQTLTPSSPTYTANAYFDANTGSAHVLHQGNIGASDVRNIALTSNGAEIYLDPAVFNAPQYEIEIQRSTPIKTESWSFANYAVNGQRLNLFGSYDGRKLPMTRKGIQDTLQIVRGVNIWNDPPLVERNLAIIALKTRNLSVERISVLAEGYSYVPDDTGEWSKLALTSNPAAHDYEILTGLLNYWPMPATLVDQDNLREWYDVCEAEGHTCDMLAEGTAIAELRTIVGSCGYARPFMSEKWGIVRDYDRSEEAPVQLFTMRNIADFSWAKAFPRMPAGLRVNYDRVALDYAEDQEILYRPGQHGSSNQLEQTKYVGFVDRDKVLARAKFDLAQAELRNTFYSFRTQVEWLRCRKGSLVALEYDFLGDTYSRGRIKQVVMAGDYLTEFTIDAHFRGSLQESLDLSDDITTLTDLSLSGQELSVTIRSHDGYVTTHPIAINDAEDTSTVVLNPPVLVDTTVQSPYDVSPIRTISEGCLVAIGTREKAYKRMIVLDIAPASELEADVVLVDEAPELWQ